MKVLFLGTYREQSGWGIAAQKYIRALDAVGVDVVCRPIRIRPEHAMPDERILQLEGQRANNCDVVIQNLLPHLMEYSGHFKCNIGLYYTETRNMGRCAWPMKLNLMDRLWVPNAQSVVASVRSNVKRPIEIVGVPEDTTKYDRVYDKFDCELIDKDAFVFYTIGEYTPRKNLEALVMAFHREFNSNENVALLIKTHATAKSWQQVDHEFHQMTNQMKKTMRLYEFPGKYLPEIVITQHLSDDTIQKIHARGDCFVLSSCGEGWSLPAFDAMGHGKPVIVSMVVASDFMDGNSCYFVNSTVEPVMYQNAPLHDIYTAREEWDKISVIDLQKQMRLAFTDRELYKKKSELCKAAVKEFSYEKVGQRMKELLNDIN